VARPGICYQFTLFQDNKGKKKRKASKLMLSAGQVNDLADAGSSHKVKRSCNKFFQEP
jgi:hypothetical protein